MGRVRGRLCRNVTIQLACVLAAAGSVYSQEQGYGPLIDHGLDEQLAIGADLFFSETFEGNGRTCATCHAVADNFTLPADLSAVDPQAPLMISHPLNLNRVLDLELCDAANPCDALRDNGLILVNADGDSEGPDGARSYSMRSIPHVLSLRTSKTAPPGSSGERLGWSGDGSPGPNGTTEAGSLNEFAIGAVEQHFTLTTERVDKEDFRVPSLAERDAMEEFQLELGRTKDIALSEIIFFEPNAIAGKAVFEERCARCHGNAGAISNGANRNFNTGIEEQRNNTCDQLLGQSGQPGVCHAESGSIVAGGNQDGGLGTDNKPLDETGQPDLDDLRWGDGTFNVPPLIEAADTAPFFHDNRVKLLEDAIITYGEPAFLSSPACLNLPLGTCGLDGLVDVNGQINVIGSAAEIGATLRILNAGLNISMGAQRMNLALELMESLPGDHPSVQHMVVLAREEIADAHQVLGVVDFAGEVFPLTGPTRLARDKLAAVLSALDAQIPSASFLGVAIAIQKSISASEDHLSANFYDESEVLCDSRGVTVTGVEYHDCRWLFELGTANTIFDNRGVGPSIIGSETELTILGNPDGTVTLALRWVTQEWTNPLFEETVLTHLSNNPNFPPITFSGVTRLPNGEYERSYSHTVPCTPKARYRMDVKARVGGVTETDFDFVKLPRFCPQS